MRKKVKIIFLREETIKKKGNKKVMTKQEFLEKHNFQEQDFKNLLRFEEARKSGAYNMYEYLALMTKLNINGGGKLASWVIGNYGEFLEVIGGENNEKN